MIKDKPAYFAKKMQKAMKGLGTDDEAMVRVCVTRCECDMVQIKNSFQQQFNGTLASWIAVRTNSSKHTSDCAKMCYQLYANFDILCVIFGRIKNCVYLYTRTIRRETTRRCCWR